MNIFFISDHFLYKLGFYEPAIFETEGTKRHLLHNGYRFYQNGYSSKRTTSWLCVSYYRNRCRARAITTNVDGIEMARLNSPHSHPPFGAPKRYFTNEDHHVFRTMLIEAQCLFLYRTIQKNPKNKFPDGSQLMKREEF